ncbi:phage holin family protein [Roseomonas hellenica]|uniref:Phage holin family protein n=1 Tax=Plastoroseomonas hellenica TaxID=2687306 RepID=A0ABS5F6M8_9PROT|nr:phage holin family protein [Plastoroseomonas hellenica]MBR0668225.1 phage holin family protein [Plastoroseomonas hellenica]
MRTLRLLGVAAQAEGLRLRREARGLARRVVWQVAAGLFATAAVVMLHLTAWHALLPPLGPTWAAAAITVFDLLAAGLCVLLGRSRYDPVAAEALYLRREMLRSAAATDPLGEVMGAALRTPAAVIGGAIAEALASRFRR